MAGLSGLNNLNEEGANARSDYSEKTLFPFRKAHCGTTRIRGIITPPDIA
jgi:hypothetical protein